MRHLVAQHRGQFRGIARERDQPARHVKLAGRKRERVDRTRIEDRHLVGLIGTIRCRDKPVDRLANQRFELRIVIATAIGRENSLMLALGGRRLRDRAVGLGRTCRRRRGLEPADIAAGGQRKSRAQQDGRRPKAAARACLAPSHTPCHSGYSLFVQGANSRPATQPAPPATIRFVARHAPRRSRGRESVDFRGT